MPFDDGERRPAPLPAACVPADLLFRLAHEREAAGRLDEAGELLLLALDAAPRHGDVLHLLGVVAYKQDRLDQAAAFMERAIECGLDLPLYHRNICEVYRAQGRPDDALAAVSRAVQLDPSCADAWLNRGVVLADQLRLDEAAASFGEALRLDPASAGAHFGLAEIHLARGDYHRGWEEYEWRVRMPDAKPVMPPSDRPQWDGAALRDGTLLLVADQGFGDAIQFCRYIPWAAARCAGIALACSTELAPILAQLHPGMRVFTDWDKRGEFAAWCPLTGLPRLAGREGQGIPAAVPYLHPDPGRRERWRARLDGLAPPGFRRVGVVWAGRPAHRHDRRRSTSLAALAPVAAVPGVALFSLQKGDAALHSGRYRGSAPLVNLSPEIGNFGDTMAIMAELDMVLSVDTSVAHLAGAIGRPVWIMLPWNAEWRWLLQRPDTPWYPSARLFRQPAPGRWDLAAAAVAEALRSDTELSRFPAFGTRDGPLSAV